MGQLLAFAQNFGQGGFGSFSAPAFHAPQNHSSGAKNNDIPRISFDNGHNDANGSMHHPDTHIKKFLKKLFSHSKKDDEKTHRITLGPMQRS